MNNMTPFQIGARKGHRPQEHIFLMKSMMQLFQMKKKPLIIQLFDVSKFFDKENLPDVLNEIYRCGIKGKKYRLLYKLNEKRVIKMKTAVGTTDEAEVKEGVGQGSLDAGILSSASLGMGVQEAFRSSQWEASYGRIRLQPALYQDDIGRMVSSLQAAQAGNTFLSSLMESKLLSFNTEKSICLVI